MRLFWGIVIAMALVSADPNHVQAHEIDGFEPRPIISDLNVIAITLERETLSKGDVFLISATGCVIARTAIRDQLTINMAQFIAERGYPSPDVINQIEYTEFAQYEFQALQLFGAYESTMALFERIMEERANIPDAPPEALLGGLVEELSLFEEITCDVREKAPDDLGVEAEEGEVEFAYTVGRVALGLGVMAVDGGTAIAFPNVGTAILSMASGGLGWDLVKEGVPVLRDLWEKFF